MKTISPIGAFLEYANRLKFKNLFVLILVLFILDVFVPDMVPMLDEIILGVLAIILGNLKKKASAVKSGTVIEGEVVNEDKRM